MMDLSANREGCTIFRQRPRHQPGEVRVEELDFLGHRLSTAGVTPLSGSLQVIFYFPSPHTVKDLQGFLGMLIFTVGFCQKLHRSLSH
jgi:hypothetical protein